MTSYKATIGFLSAAAIALLGASPESPAPSPSCAQPVVPARIVNTVMPATPEEAVQQNIYGEVHVDVKLDTMGGVYGAEVVSSPNTILNRPSLMSAILSRYTAKVEACIAVPATYHFIIDYGKVHTTR